MLFLVGLRLDVQMIRSTGPVAVVTGLSQVVITAVVGYLVALAFGMDGLTALYIALALTFSSTIIIVKLLSDKRELDQLHGRIAVGLLIVQDLVVVMIVLTAFGQDTGGGLGHGVVDVLLKGGGAAGRGVAVDALCAAPVTAAHRKNAGPAGVVRRRVCGVDGRAERMVGIQLRSGCLSRRSVVGEHTVPGRPRGPAGQPA